MLCLDRPTARSARFPGVSLASQLPLSSRDKILDVSEALFAQRGFAGVGLRQVAESAGLSKSSLFHHFRSKGQLYGEVLGRVLVRIEERLRPALGASGDPVEQLRRLVGELVDALAEQPATARLLLRSLVEDDQAELESLPEFEAAERTLASIVAGVERLLTEGVECGAFRPASVAHTMQSLIGSTVYHFASGEFGASVLGRPLLSAEAVSEHKRELIALLETGIVAKAAV